MELSRLTGKGRWCLMALTATLAFVLTAHQAGAQTIAYHAKVGLGGGAAPEAAWAILLADGLGYFAEEGIQVDDYILGSGAVLNQGFIAGDMEFLQTGISEVVNNRLAGVSAKAVLEYADKPIFSLVVRNDLKDQVQSVTDLRGKILGFSAPGSLAWFTARVWLGKAGLDADTDLQFTPIGADAGVIYQSLQSGRIDAFPAWEPVASRVVIDGVAFRLIDSSDANQTQQWFGFDPWQDTPLMVQESLIREKPNLVGGFAKASMKAMDWIGSHTPEEIADAVVKSPKGSEIFGALSRDVLLAVASNVKAKQGTGCFYPESVEGIIKQAANLQVVKGFVSFQEYADTTWSGVCR